MLEIIILKLKLSNNFQPTEFKSNMNISEAIQKVKDVGLNVYTPKTKDAGFIKLYLEPITQLLPYLSGNALKVLVALSSELQWNEVEVILTREKIEDLTGLSGNTVRVAIDELEEKKLIKRLGPNVRRSYMVSNHYVRLGKNK